MRESQKVENPVSKPPLLDYRTPHAVRPTNAWLPTLALIVSIATSPPAVPLYCSYEVLDRFPIHVRASLAVLRFIVPLVGSTLLSALVLRRQFQEAPRGAAGACTILALVLNLSWILLAGWFFVCFRSFWSAGPG